MSARQSPRPRRRPSALDRFVLAGMYRLMGMPGWVDFVLTGGDVSREARLLMLTIVVTLDKDLIERRGYQRFHQWRRRYRPQPRVVRGRRLVPHYRPRVPWIAFEKPTADSDEEVRMGEGER